LRKIWKNSLEHEQGPYYYDKECRVAICIFMESVHYDEDGNESHEVYLKTDLHKLEQLIIRLRAISSFQPGHPSDVRNPLRTICGPLQLRGRTVLERDGANFVRRLSFASP